MPDDEQAPLRTSADPVRFAVPPVDVVSDLHGDPVVAELVVFLNGNQWMVLPDLLASFAAAHPEAGSLFVETLPPGVLVEQLRRGALAMGSLRLSVVPDVLAAAPPVLQALHREGLVGPPRDYAANDLAMLVPPDNPLAVASWEDLARPGLRIAMPDPRTEGIGELIAQVLTRVGGEALRREVMDAKAERGETQYTQIHHRQSPLWIDQRSVDVAPVWTTEATHHDPGGSGVVRLPADENITGRYAVSTVTAGRHGPLAIAFVEHLVGPLGRVVYAAHGFGTPIG